MGKLHRMLRRRPGAAAPDTGPRVREPHPRNPENIDVNTTVERRAAWHLAAEASQFAAACLWTTEPSDRALAGWRGGITPQVIAFLSRSPDQAETPLELAP
jgi:hypothetical protein